MQRDRCRVLIIGGGPGGYVCGIRAAQLGLNTIVVEAAKPGGTCLNIGCIPSKALIHAADEFAKVAEMSSVQHFGIRTAAPQIDFKATIAWKDGIVARLTRGVAGLLSGAGARLVEGKAHIVDGKTVDVTGADGATRITCDHLVIATGSQAQALPDLPFGGKVLSSTEALALPEVPRSLAIVGAGYIGLEIGTAFAKLGAQVTLIEAAPRILPQYDEALTAPVLSRLREIGVAVHCNAQAKGLSDDDAVLFVALPEGELQIAADKVLVTIGRAPVLDGFGLNDLQLDRVGPYLRVDAHCATSMRGVYAVGDVTGEPMLAHRAMAQGTLVAEHIAGKSAAWDKRAIPAICFTDPEIVSVGAAPGTIHGARSVQFPFAANGRAMTLGRSEGFVRVVFDPSSELILGIQAVGPGVSEMANGYALALEMGATLTDIAATIHAHPTLGEASQEAALAGLGNALHI
ncbi:MAG: dihydrolipoyl dehydrogenase [Pseudomonadota bacterium]